MTELERYRRALEIIRDHEGEVCGMFEICQHRACQSSLRSRELADAALLDHSEFAEMDASYKRMEVQS